MTCDDCQEREAVWQVNLRHHWCSSCVLRAVAADEPIRAVIRLDDLLDPPDDGPDRQAEDDYRNHSPSHTGLYEAP